MEKVFPLCQFRGEVTTESEERVDAVHKIVVGHIREILVPQA